MSFYDTKVEFKELQSRSLPIRRIETRRKVATRAAAKRKRNYVGKIGVDAIFHSTVVDVTKIAESRAPVASRG